MNAASGRPREAYLDTNVLLAFLAGASHPLFPQACSVFEAVRAGRLRLVMDVIVVAELAWLAKSVLGVTAAQLAEQLLDLLQAPGFRVPQARSVHQALEMLVAHPHLDVADAWLAAQALVEGPPAIVSFDRDLDAVEGLERIG